MTRSYFVALAAVIFLVSPVYGFTSPAKRCQALSILKLPDTVITLADLQSGGPFTPPSSPEAKSKPKPMTLPTFCRVTATIRPTSDSDIRFEVWMPARGWNGNFQQEGNTNFAGSIQYELMAVALRHGFASASTDDGHQNPGSPTWAIGHPEKIKDFGYRGVHMTAEDAKAIIRAFYGQSPRWNYFIGCSDGGREALMEAQRFPDDFNGILAGSPANNWVRLFVGFVWGQQATLDHPGSYIPSSKLHLLQAGAIAACDAKDGVKDGVIEDPSHCRFNPAVLRCKGADKPDCLTAAQVNAAKKIYVGPVNPRTNSRIFPGYEPGGEANPFSWSYWITGKSRGKNIQSSFAKDFFGDMVFQNPKWNFRSFNFDTDVSLAEARMSPILDSTNPDLSRFKAHGGKLIQYHGWADSGIPPLNSIDYYNDVVRVTGGEARNGRHAALENIRSFYRLYMVPGMGHCRYGVGPTTLGGPFQPPAPKANAQDDIIKALERWVERGVAPRSIIGTQYVDGAVAKGIARTWLLCPYPEEAHWTGKGSFKSAAASFCRLPAGKNTSK